MSQKNFERKVLGLVFSFLTEKSFKIWESTCFLKEKWK